LADAELYLFDALFDVTLRVGALRREEFAALNLPYTHDLDPPALDALVLRLAEAGLVRLRRASRRPDLGARITLSAASARVAEAFLETARACGLYAPVMHSLSRRRLRARVVPWKPPESLIELRVPLRSEDDSPRVDWVQYEASRSWWRSIPELTTLAA
jgi:hypothetical protein